VSESQAPDVLHHVMARGIEQCSIFKGNHDREEFILCLSELALKKAWVIYAWALMPNHYPHCWAKSVDERGGNYAGKMGLYLC
jgi:REP element-mobilizing transposase RayT